ncbi:hypothetical protein EJB05_00831, partial [Eragrostis curvula]
VTGDLAGGELLPPPTPRATVHPLLRLSHQRASFPPPLLTAAGCRQPSVVATNSSIPAPGLLPSISKKDQQILTVRASRRCAVPPSTEPPVRRATFHVSTIALRNHVQLASVGCQLTACLIQGPVGLGPPEVKYLKLDSGQILFNFSISLEINSYMESTSRK